MKRKGVAAWLAAVAGSLGAHRFYLYGARDVWAWAHPLPTLLGLAGLRQAQVHGVDTPALLWALPLFGVMVAVACLQAILIGLTPDERWNDRHNPGTPAPPSGWPAVLATVLALLMGGTALMAAVAYAAQRYFELAA